jgi:hypothetical protein
VKHDDERRNGHDDFHASRTGDNSDERLVVGLLKAIQRDMKSDSESIREELKRLRESIDRHTMDHEDHALRIAALEQSARRRAARK